MLEARDHTVVRRWVHAAVRDLEAHRAEVDALNVYPVPDGDTGRNLLLTLRAGATALDTTADEDPVAALGTLARGAAAGAVGNSGFILSQLLRGFAEAAARRGAFDTAALRTGLAAGAELARAAVFAPVDGTILSVAEAAARAVSDHAGTPAEVAAAAVAAADSALQDTTEQLPELAAAGVVDAGGRGLVLILDALVAALGGPAVELRPVRLPVAGHGQADVGNPAFEVQYLLDSTPPAVERLQKALADLGDSLAVVATGADQWKVHVHVDDAGAAVEAGIEAGRPHRISVVALDTEGREVAPAGQRAIVAVAPGPGLTHLFQTEQVHVVDGADGPPSTEDVIAAVRATGAREVVLLPNASQVTGVAEAAASWFRGQRGRAARVSVIPTRSPVQGLSAIAVHDSARGFDDDVVAMAEAAAATRFAEITTARTEALTAVGICQPGDILGLIDGEVVEIGRGMMAVAFGIVDRLLGVGAELITILTGAETPHRAGALLESHIRGRSPFTDVRVYEGGQADVPVIIGIE